MDIKHKINLLCFLVAIKENKAFYAKHKTDLNRSINTLKDEIEQHTIRGRPKLKEFNQYILTIIHIITEYFNSK